jgi:hypothetical protein
MSILRDCEGRRLACPFCESSELLRARWADYVECAHCYEPFTLHDCVVVADYETDPEELRNRQDRR